MIVFYVIAGLLVLAALLLVVPPLLGLGRHGRENVDHDQVNLVLLREAMVELDRDREAGTIGEVQYEQSRMELERRLLEEVNETQQPVDAAKPRSGKISAVLVALLVPAFVFGFYLYQGRPDVIAPGNAGGDVVADNTPEGMAARIQGMVSSLADRLKKNPDDAAGWAMLGRSYIVLERFEDARAALEKAAGLKPDDPQLLADLADSLAMTSGQSLQGRPTELIRQALNLDPNNQKALWLAGTSAYEQSNYAEALKYWRKLYMMLPEGSETAKTMEGNIAEAQALQQGIDPSEIMRAEPASVDSGVNGGDARVTGKVRISDRLKGRVRPDDTLFIFAKAVQGPPMPLAVKKVKAGELPFAFELDDSMAMNAQMRLSRFQDVVVVARISQSGNAMPESGDLEGRSAPVKVGSTVPEITIDQVIP